MSSLDITRTPLKTAACAAVAYYLDATLREEPPSGRRWQMPAERDNLPIGGYLLGYGYLQPRQLRQAITLQRDLAARGYQPMLGEVLVRQQVISPRVLATMLAVQIVDRALSTTPPHPSRLEERLVHSGHISPVQAARTIQLQTWLRSKGIECSMADLLLQQSLVTPAELDALQPLKDEALVAAP